MSSLEEIEKRLLVIEKRNRRVEYDKAWEGSITRRGVLMLLTYISLGLYMNAININAPWLNAIIPTVGFMLSTLTLPFFKKIWLKNKI